MSCQTAIEADRSVRDATGNRYLVDDGQGVSGHYIPATGERTPASLALLQRYAPMVEHLARAPMIPAVTLHTLLFDMAGWHTDTGHAVPSVKVVSYLEPLGEHNGALRVLPGSHRLDERGPDRLATRPRVPGRGSSRAGSHLARARARDHQPAWRRHHV